ncbi:MAG TPA: 4Fe-4S dicluster domain-containing protein, partial [Anaerolineales bacterium]
PRPMTKLTWDNAVLISPSTALRLGLANEEVVNLRFQDFEVAAPVWIMPGQPDNSVTVNLGYGRQRGGRLIEGVGFNANAIRTTQAFWFGQGLEIQKTGGRYALATTQHHQSMEGRDFVRVADIREFADNPDLFHTEDEGESASLYPEYEYDGHAWGMSINLNTCIGCNACVIACQAENNIPVVGKEQVQDGHEMHWLRIDRYFKGDLDNPEVLFQAVPCMHCEKAPCEPVCPVEATVHDEEGLNEMIYNRCVGTRYCSNNCPYKVRRFNFLQYADQDTIPLKMMRNPDVSVRSRGVMEKCTYCVQRINTTRIQAEVEGRPLEDGEVKTACQQACPTKAIVFGDINDPSSQVTQLKQQPHNYALLAELNTQPRTTYLAKLRNPNPMMET